MTEKKKKKRANLYDKQGVEGEIYAHDDYRCWDHGDNLFLIESWARSGDTQETIAKKIGITGLTFGRWVANVEPIKKAVRQSKEIIDYKVENALLKLALGYEAVEEKVILGKPDKEGNCVVKRETVTKDIGPNVTACMAWLNNRKPDDWKRNRDNTLELDDDDRNISIKIYKATSPDDKTIITDSKSDEDEWEDEE